MAETSNPLVAFSDHAAQLIERTGGGIVGIHGGGRRSSSSIHWRSKLNADSRTEAVTRAAQLGLVML